jgi:hypothetical protein
MKRTMLKLFTVLWLFSMYVMLVWTFMSAYQSPYKSVTVLIDKYSEAQVEFYMLSAGFAFAALGSAFLIFDIRRDFLSRENSRLSEQRAI